MGQHTQLRDWMSKSVDDGLDGVEGDPEAVNVSPNSELLALIKETPSPVRLALG